MDPADNGPLSSVATATVAILTFNGKPYIAEVLDAALAQETTFPFEVLVIDSGSSDGTVDIVSSTNARLVSIDNSEFGHGRTRNLAIDIAHGDYVAFLTQDATPSSPDWLQHLVDAFSLDPTVGAVYGPHLPRPDADPKTVRDMNGFFAGMGPPDQPTLHRRGDIVFFSDVNSCVRKDVNNQLRFRDLPYAEDQAFGKDLLEAGFTKVFEPRAAVVHSHAHPAFQYFQRMYDEWSGLKTAIGAEYPRRFYVAAGLAAKNFARDTRYLARLPGAGWPSKVRWLIRAAWMDISREISAYLVEHAGSTPKWLRDRLSHERSVKRRLERRGDLVPARDRMSR